MGFSSGGGGSWLYAQTNQTFSAAIPLASSYNTIDRIDVPMFVIHGENDEVFPLEVIENSINQSNINGSNIELQVAKGLGHDIRNNRKLHTLYQRSCKLYPREYLEIAGASTICKCEHLPGKRQPQHLSGLRLQVILVPSWPPH